MSHFTADNGSIMASHDTVSSVNHRASTIVTTPFGSLASGIPLSPAPMPLPVPRAAINQTRLSPERPPQPTTLQTASRGVPPPTLPKPHVAGVLSMQAVVAEMLTPQSGPTEHLVARVLCSRDRDEQILNMIKAKVGETPFSARVVGLLSALDTAIAPRASDEALLALKSECEMYADALGKVEKPIAPLKHRTLGKMTPHYSKGEHEAYEQALALYPGDSAKILGMRLLGRVTELAKLGSHDNQAPLWRDTLNTTSNEIVGGIMLVLWNEVARDVIRHHRAAVNA